MACKKGENKKGVGWEKGRNHKVEKGEEGKGRKSQVEWRHIDMCAVLELAVIDSFVLRHATTVSINLVLAIVD